MQTFREMEKPEPRLLSSKETIRNSLVTPCIEDAREERIQTLRPIDGNAFVRPRTASNFRRKNDFRYRDISNIRVLYNRT